MVEQDVYTIKLREACSKIQMISLLNLTEIAFAFAIALATCMWMKFQWLIKYDSKVFMLSTSSISPLILYPKMRVTIMGFPMCITVYLELLKCSCQSNDHAVK